MKTTEVSKHLSIFLYKWIMQIKDQKFTVLSQQKWIFWESHNEKPVSGNAGWLNMLTERNLLFSD